MLRIIIANILILSVCQSVNANVGWAKLPRPVKPIVVAVIDTGIDEKLMDSDILCKEGHKDFTGTGLQDNHGHGTHISGLIEQYAKNYIFRYGESPNSIKNIKANYCQIILKYYDPKARGADNLINTIKSFRWAIDHKVDVINYSGGGKEFSNEEKLIVTEALNKGIKVVVAAGNESKNLSDDPCSKIKSFKKKFLCLKNRDPKVKYGVYYPAIYDNRLYVVGNLVNYKTRVIASSSNYGTHINTWEVGTNVLSRLPNAKFGFMSGTSQATAIKSGKLVREMLLNK